MRVEESNIVRQARSLVCAFVVTLLESRADLFCASVLDDAHEALKAIDHLQNAMSDARSELAEIHQNLSNQIEDDE